DRRFHLVFERLRTKPADLGQPCDHRRRGADHPPVMRRQKYLVVGDQPREQAGRPSMAYERQRKQSLARAGDAGDHNPAIPEHDRAGMEVVAQSYASAGRVTVNRAPRISPGLPPAMFSAVSAPPCASTIWRLIDSPSPEFWPKASPDGRSV